MSPYRPAFVHRSNTDGTTDTICCKCFVTVARTKVDTEIESAEQHHKCDPWALEYWTRMAATPVRGTSQPPG